MQQPVGNASNLMNALMNNANIQSGNNDNSWDYLNKMSLNVRGHLLGINSAIMTAMNLFDNNRCYTGEVRVLVDGLLIDLDQYATNWRMLNEQHKDRSGFGLNADEHRIILNTGLEYIQTFEVFISKTSLAVGRLQELVNELEYRLRNQVMTLEDQVIQSLVIQQEENTLNHNV